MTRSLMACEKLPEALLCADGELLLSKDSAENGEDFISGFGAEGELANGGPKPRGCDSGKFSRFIAGPMTLALDAAEECGLASKDDSFFRLRSPVGGG